MDPLTLTDLGRAMRRRWRTLVAGSLAGAAAGLAVGAALPTTYTAQAVVQVEAPDPALVDMAAEEAVATSRRVTSEALDALGDPALTIIELETATRAETVKSSRVLRVTYAAPTPGAAARGADAVAEAYLAVRSLDASRRRSPGSAPTGEVVDPARVPLSASGLGRGGWAVGGTALGVLAAAPLAARPTRARPTRSRAALAS